MATECENGDRCRFEIGEVLWTEQRCKRHAGLWLPLEIPVWIDRLTPYFSDPGEGVKSAEQLVCAHARVRSPGLPMVFHVEKQKNDFLWFYRSSKATPLIHYSKDRRLGMSEIRAIVDDLATGLSSLHAAGLVHGSLTVDKILMAGRGRILLTDTGLARQCNTLMEHREAEEGKAPPSLPGPSSDIAGWGSILGCLLTLQPNFGRVLVAGLPTDNFDAKLARKTLMECEVSLRLVEVVYRSLSAVEGSGNPYATIQEAWAAFTSAIAG